MDVLEKMAVGGEKGEGQEEGRETEGQEADPSALVIKRLDSGIHAIEREDREKLDFEGNKFARASGYSQEEGEGRRGRNGCERGNEIRRRAGCWGKKKLKLIEDAESNRSSCEYLFFELS